MPLRGLNEIQKLILLYLYDRKTPTVPPIGLSKHEIAKMFDIETKDLSEEVKGLMKRAYIYPFKVGNEECYMITKYGINEIEKQQERLIEIGTSGIKVKTGKKLGEG